jgi:hypothetical protein
MEKVEEKAMNGISAKYVTVLGILLFSLVQLDGTRDSQSIEAHLDLIQNGNLVTVVVSE